MFSIDINADLGESLERLDSGADFELMRYITSASIACGGHAGDERTMVRVLGAAKELGTAVGAHPGYPDRKNFGRVELRMASAAIEKTVREQIAALARWAIPMGLPVAYVKPHGALYHAANRDQDVATALARAVLAVDPALIMIAQAGSAALEEWRSMGLRYAAEAFADRAYEPDGTLRKRTSPGALIASPEGAAQQALDIALKKNVNCADGSVLSVAADTICIHSDTPGAAVMARAVREALEAAGITIRPLCQPGAFRNS